eukprot:PLAT3120.2.p1 GENE.PLAT3120.2~~PLAT3120.2.p1  ORF type:complete len:124 (+),score=63.29 PLAT3120.2:29-373(+)
MLRSCRLLRGVVAGQVEDKLRAAFSPLLLAVENESGQHSVPPGSETHFKVTLVADALAGVPPVARHRKVHAVLQDELDGPVHALSLKLYTPEQWEKAEGKVPRSPACRGGSKAE